MATKKTQTQAKATKAEPRLESQKKTSAKTETVEKATAKKVESGRAKVSERATASKDDNGKSADTKAPGSSSAPSREARKTMASFEQIAFRAYLLWQERGCPHGGDVEDWLRAECELTTVK